MTIFCARRELSKELPAVSVLDAGKMAVVGEDGKWGLGEVLPELPPLPEEDGEYTLQLTIDEGAAVLTWEEIPSE